MRYVINKKLVLWLAVFVLCVCATSLRAQAADEEFTVNAEERTLYCLNPSYTKVPMGEEYPKTFQLEVTGAEDVKYKRLDGYAATVSDTGLITARNAGTTVVQVISGEQEKVVLVHVISYADIYIEKVVSEYLADNITDDMSDYEKLCAIANFPCQYDYGGSTTMGSMILSGSGDCWASTNAINTLCKRIGFDSRVRSGSKDEGTLGSTSHRNNIVILPNGDIYEVEAGYVEPAPRTYTIKNLDGLLEYRIRMNEDKVVREYELLQNNDNTWVDTYEVPSEYMGRNVGFIADNFANGSYINSDKYVLPETIISIGKYAFSGFKLKQINLPNSLKELYGSSFSSCPELTTIICSDDHPYFRVKDGVIYNKDMTELISAPSATEFTVPDNVTSICENAFCGNTNLCEATIGKGVAEIKAYTFSDCTNLIAVYIPSTVTSISRNAFGKSQTRGFTIYGEAGSYAETFANENGFTFREKGTCGLTGISFKEQSYEMQVGKTKLLSPNYLPKITDDAICWKSSDPSVVSVVRGNLEALKPGYATVTCYAYDDPTISASLEITVIEKVPVEALSLEEKEIHIVKNQYKTVWITCTPKNAYDIDSKCEFEKGGIVKVENSADRLIITGLTVGKETVLIRSRDNSEVTDEITVYVTEPLQSLALDQENLHLMPGDTVKLTPIFTPEKDIYDAVKWNAYGDGVITIDDEGNLTAVGAGTGEVYCTSMSSSRGGGSPYASCKVFVGALVERIEPTITEAWLPVGQIGYVGFNYKVYPEEGTAAPAVYWDEEDPEIAVVQENQSYRVWDDAYLKINALKLGDVYIVGRTSDGGNASAKILLHVVTPIESFSLDQEQITVKQGESAKLSYTILPASVSDQSVKWSVNEPEIAKVSEDGTVTGISPGKTAVWCTTNYPSADGVSTRDMCMITVEKNENPPAEDPTEEPTEEPDPEDDPTDPPVDTPSGDMTKLTINEPESCVYDGTAQTPAVTVTDGDTALYEGTDYTLSYENNVYAGTATVTIKGIGSYEGTVVKNFTIARKILAVDGLKFKDKYYNGSKYMELESIYPSVDGVIPGDDVTVTTTRNDYVITGTKSPGDKQRRLTKGLFVISGADAANYRIKVGCVATGKIKKVTVAGVNLKKTESFYNGRAQKPSISRIYGNNGSRILIKMCDITYTRAGAETTDFTSPGTITVTVTGKGPYKGSVSQDFVIK